MSAQNSHLTDVKLKLQKNLKLYFSAYHLDRCYPGLILQQGYRTILQINVPGSNLPELLQIKPATSNNPDLGKDRPEIKGHVQEIQKYIIDRSQKNKKWILGTLTANTPPSVITIDDFFNGFCIVRIPKGSKLDLTDGQHRVKAVCQLLKNKETRGFVENQSFPITLILEDKLEQCQTDFCDLAKAKPVDNSLLLSFGENIDKVGLTKKIIEQVPMFIGKTDKINKSPSKKSKFIYTLNYIARSVACALSDDPENKLEGLDIEKYSKILAIAFNQFFSECNQTRYFHEKTIEKISLEEIKEFKKQSILGVSVGLEILGRLFYCTYDSLNNCFNPLQIAQIARLDWERKNELWHNNVIRINLKSDRKNTTIAWGGSAISDAVKAAKNELKWK